MTQKYIVANVVISGQALPLARLNFVTKITPKRRDIVLGGDSLSSAARLTREEVDEVMARMSHSAMTFFPCLSG